MDKRQVIRKIKTTGENIVNTEKGSIEKETGFELVKIAGWLEGLWQEGLWQEDLDAAEKIYSTGGHG